MSEKKEKHNYFKIIKTAIGILYKTSKGYFIIVFILGFTSSIPDIINLFVWKNIIDEIAVLIKNNGGSYQMIIFLFCIHLLLALVRLILMKISNYIKEIYVTMVDKYITDETIRILESMDLQDIEDPNLHNDIKKTNQESTSRSIGILDSLINLIRNVTTLFGTVGILASLNIGIVVLMMLSIIPSAIISKKSMEKLFEVYTDRYEKIRFYIFLKDTVSRYENFKELRLFSGIEYIREKINTIFDQIIKQDKGVKKELLLKSSGGNFIELALTYIFKIIIVISGIVNKFTVGGIIMSIESATKLQNALMSSIDFVLVLYENCLYLLSYDRLQQLKTDKFKKISKNLINDFDIDTIELKNVSFQYKSSRRYVLENISLKFKKGYNYAIVGYNGSGKSTLIKLILGLYTPTKGEILINGISIDQYDKEAYFEKMSAVFQDPVKLPLTVRENIGISKSKDIGNVEIINKASILGQSYDFINTLKDKFETKLLIGWKNSEELSTGQWQRIAISRGFVRDPQVMVFDEPTASLDSKSESGIFKNITSKSSSRINILITHRFVNIHTIDEIIVLNQGEINGRGSHDFLFKTNELYHDLYITQADYYVETRNEIGT